jgi:catechol 2,3-dioxygenase-like lactoylglutathione lyase family enzyme
MSDETYPTILQTVLDCGDPRAVAEFYRQMFGLRYRAGDEPPPEGEPDENGQDWLVLLMPDGQRSLAFGKADDLAETTWPEPGVPQQMHLDTGVPSVAELEHQHERALALGARLRFDRTDDPDEPLRVYADPAGHLFCIFVA